MSPPDNKRSHKTVFNLTGFRGRLIALIVTAGFACIAFVQMLFYGYVLDSYDFILRHSTLPAEIVADRYEELWGIAFALGGIILLVVLVVAVWSLYITQRVAGPAYHLHRVIEQIRAGKLDERVHLRKRDEFHELARSFNALMDELQQKPK
ncbi:MAG TPA: HAMP domain-containing protein [Xanthomonadales bacterium]|nr:HAMP domain-containing protein [Xanthomonadales bacterium]